MPVVTIDIIEGLFSKGQKEEMMRRVSEVVAEIECRPDPKENMFPFIYCIIREHKWGTSVRTALHSLRRCCTR